MPSRTRWLQSAAAESLRAFLAFRLMTTPSRELNEEAFALSHWNGCAFYDMLYLALEKRKNVSLVIADLRLYERVCHLPEILWIGDYAHTRR